MAARSRDAPRTGRRSRPRDVSGAVRKPLGVSRRRGGILAPGRRSIRCRCIRSRARPAPFISGWRRSKKRILRAARRAPIACPTTPGWRRGPKRRSRRAPTASRKAAVRRISARRRRREPGDGAGANSLGDRDDRRRRPVIGRAARSGAGGRRQSGHRLHTAGSAARARQGPAIGEFTQVLRGSMDQPTRSPRARRTVVVRI